MKQKYKQDNGVAGLTILLSIIVMLFVIGLLIMIFTIMGSKMSDATYDPTTASVQGEDVSADYFSNGTGYTLEGTNRNARSYTIIALYNNTDEILLSGNYTLTGLVLKNATALTGLADVKVNYTYIYDADNLGTETINATYQSIAGTTEWFDIFVVISAMVVLILLVVIIITAIRSSGMVTGASSGASGIGTA
jgi:uncharacterized membrane protein